jgi:hypothetical protein
MLLIVCSKWDENVGSMVMFGPRQIKRSGTSTEELHSMHKHSDLQHPIPLKLTS